LRREVGLAREGSDEAPSKLSPHLPPRKSTSSQDFATADDNGNMRERTLISSGSPFEPQVGFSRAVVIGDRALVAGTAPIWPDGSCPADVYLQAKRCLEIILDALAAAGFGPDHVVRTRLFLVDRADAEAVGRAHGELFSAARPASTMVVVKELLDPRWRVEIEAEAIR